MLWRREYRLPNDLSCTVSQYVSMMCYKAKTNLHSLCDDYMHSTYDYLIWSNYPSRQLVIHMARLCMIRII